MSDSYCSVQWCQFSWLSALKWKESNAVVELMCHQQKCSQSALYITWRGVCWKNLRQVQLYEVLFPPTSHQNHCQHYFQKMSQMITKKCKTISFICEVNFNFLRSSRQSNCDTIFAVIVSFLKKSVHIFNIIRNWRVKTGFQIVKFRQIWSFLIKNTNFPSVTFWYAGG